MTLLSEFIGETNVMAAVDSAYIGTNGTVYTDGVDNDVYDDYKYEKNKDGNTSAIIEYRGNEKNINIPSMIDGLKVTVIKDNAFSTAKMKSVKIPEGVTTIEYFAFKDCENLKKVTIPSSVT